MPHTPGFSRDAAVRDVIARYCRAVDRQDWTLMRSCYHDDAIDDHGFAVATRDEFIAISQRMAGSLSDLESHFVTRGTIRGVGDLAWSESYCVGNQLLDRDGVITHARLAGRLLDRFEKRSGQWRIARRQLVMDWTRIDRTELTRMNTPKGASGPADPSFAFFPLGEVREHDTVVDHWITHERVRDLIAQSLRAVDRRDVGSLLECFVAGAPLVLADFEGDVAAFAQLIASDSEDAAPVSSHLIGTTQLKVSGVSALAETYVQIVTRSQSEGIRQDRTVLGRLLDHGELADGRWRLSSRVLIVDWATVAPVQREFDLPTGTAIGRRDARDASVAHFS